MKRIYAIILVCICLNTYAAIQTNEEGITISLTDKWQNTLIGSLLIDTDFVFMNAKTRDMLSIKLFPKNILFDSKNVPKSAEQITKTMHQFASIYANDIFFKEQEVIIDTYNVELNKENAVVFTSKFHNSDDFNYTWVGNVNNHMVLLKITTKSKTLSYETSDILQIIDSINITKSSIKIAHLKNNPNTLGYRFKLYQGISPLKNHTDNEIYKNMNAVFVEEDAISAYVISSHCTDINIPNSLLNNVLLNDLGIEKTLFSGPISHNKQELPLVIGEYSTANDDIYHMISTIKTDHNCQHLLAYIVEKEFPLVDRFLKFIDHFETQPIDSVDFLTNLPKNYLDNYANTLLDLAYKFYQLKMYTQSNYLYKKSYTIKPSEDTLYSVLNTYNLNYEFQKGLDYIDSIKFKELSTESMAWKAWFFSKLNKRQQAADTFKIIFDNEYSNDEDFFKYIEQLEKLKEYQKINLLVQKYKSSVNDQQKIKLVTAQIKIKTDPKLAKTYILSLMSDENLLINHQFDLLDQLIQIDAYEEIITYANNRIEKGFESAVLLNYLGDAYNALGKINKAYELMLKAHEMAPKNTVIESYYHSLRNTVGKADLSVLDENIQIVPIPESMQNKIATLKPKNKYDSYEYLYNISAYHHKIDSKNRKTLYSKIKINNQSGVANNKTLQFSFDQEYENIYINKFNVLDKDNKLITQFDVSKAYITTDNDGILADTDKLLNIPVPSLEIGVMIEYAITIESKSPSTTQPFTERLFVSSVANQYKAVVINGDLENIAVHASPDIQTHLVSDSIKYWDYDNIPNYKKTPLLPDLQDVFPVLKFSSIKNSWQKTGDEYLELINKKLNTQIENGLLLSLIAENNSPIENAKTIISYVQNNISYQAIEFGMRAQIPNKSSTTLENMYGDCKDHAVLLHDLLNSANIKAELALINSSNDINIELPTHNQFNHMIVYLPEINGGVFIDTTDKDASLDFSNPPSGMQDYHALVLEKNNSKLIQVSKSVPDNNLIKVHRTVDKNNNHYLYHEKAIINGSFASSFRNYLKSIEIDELESRILKWVNSYYSDLVLSDFKYHNLYDNELPLILEFNFFQEFDYANIKLPVFIEKYAMEFTPSPNRKWDYELKNTFKIESITKLLNGNNLKFSSINKEIDNQLMQWKISSDTKTLTFNSTIYPNRLPAENYEKLLKQSKTSYKTIENLMIDSYE
ncbi:MAG: DUF3857 domain-containing protein [Marinicellaceae bacterium]